MHAYNTEDVFGLSTPVIKISSSILSKFRSKASTKKLRKQSPSLGSGPWGFRSWLRGPGP